MKCVALLAEGVDRNTTPAAEDEEEPESPSSRRAWIEIFGLLRGEHLGPVALLAEGVDRNPYQAFGQFEADVALLAEGVDRNQYQLNGGAWQTGSPSSRRAWIEILPM